MGVFPYQEHFKVIKYISILVGLWPIITRENKWVYNIYKVYSPLIDVYFTLFLFTQIIKLVSLLIDGQANYEEISNNFCVTLLYISVNVRCKVCKRATVKKTINELYSLEKETLNGGDTNIIKIYMENCERNKLYNYLFLLNIYSLDLVYAIWPLFAEGQTKEINNTTVIIKPLPISAWIPIDPQKHYAISYIWMNINANVIGCTFTAATELITFGLITFYLGQLNILQHMLRDFGNCKAKVQEEMNITGNLASKIALKKCILKHQDIIRYVEEFNDEMKYPILLDFLQCSLQLTFIVYRILIQEEFLLMLVNAQFFIAMLLRMYMTYWNANEIVVRSEDLARVLYDMDWLEESPEIRKLIVMMMLRSQRPLKLAIGVFKAMSIETFFAILKATYSYISLFYNRRRH